MCPKNGTWPDPGMLSDNEYLLRYCNMSLEEFDAIVAHHFVPDPEDAVLIIIYVLIFVTGITGNFLVCFAVWKNKSLRTVTNYLLVNLAVADFLVVLVVLPTSIVEVLTHSWLLGEFMCKLNQVINVISIVVSVETLTAISIERWMAICFPLRYKESKLRNKVAIAVIWLIGVLSAIPELVKLRLKYHSSVPPHISHAFAVCIMDEQSLKLFHTLKFIFFFCVPLIFMGMAYFKIASTLWRSSTLNAQLNGDAGNAAHQAQLKQRKQTAKMLIMVVVIFVICYLPFYVNMIVVWLCGIKVEDPDVSKAINMIVRGLVYINSSVNPIIYNFMSTRFRREFGAVCSCWRTLFYSGPSDCLPTYNIEDVSRPHRTSMR